ncbi:MAG TPA: carboxypeptidase-like regulatory domain-containing protein [Gaiellaceae bacterium]
MTIRLARLVVLALAACALFAGRAAAGTFTVTSTVDSVDAQPGDGICADAGGVCTLRAAIGETNALPGPDSIVLPSGTYTLAIPGAGENADATGDLDVTDELAILGADRDTTTIDAAGLDRAIDVRPGASLSLSGVTVRGGFLASTASDGIRPSGGAGLRAEGDTGEPCALTIANARFTQNVAQGGPGGGLVFHCPTALSVTDTEFTQNSVTEGLGGGLYIEQVLSAASSLTRVTVSGNAVTSTDAFHGFTAGGGIGNSGGPLTIQDSTISANTATTTQSGGAQGGGIYSVGGALTLLRTTVDGNQAVGHANGGGDGGGLYGFAGSAAVTITQSTFSNNVAQADTFGVSTDGGADLAGTPILIDASTFAGNRAGFTGGASLGVTTFAVTDSTFTGNVETNGGAVHFSGFSSDAPSLHTFRNDTFTGDTRTEIDALVPFFVRNSILGPLSGSGSACTPSTTFDADYDVVSDASCTSGTHDVQTASPGLLPLAANGGPTNTIALAGGSPAIDSGDNATCTANDQRGNPRTDGHCDRGAFEAGTGGLGVFVDAPSLTIVHGAAFQVTVQLVNLGTTPITGVTATTTAPGQTLLDPTSQKSAGDLAGGASTTLTWSFRAADLCNDSPATVTVSTAGSGAPSFPTVNEPILVGGSCAHVSGLVTTDSGAPVSGAEVDICNDAGVCAVAHTSSTGRYAQDGIVPGTYHLVVWPGPAAPAGTEEGGVPPFAVTTDVVKNVALTVVKQVQSGVGVSGSAVSVSPAGVVSAGRSHPFAVSVDTTHCNVSPGSTWSIMTGGVVVATGVWSPGPGTTVTASIPTFVAPVGVATFVAGVTCAWFDIDYYDPSGTVVDGSGAPIAGATVTLFRSDTATGTFTQVPDGSTIMSPGNRSNPDATGADGTFAWNVSSGFYKVTAAAPGCVSTTTGALRVPPPVTGLVLTLSCGAPASSGGGGGGGTPPASQPPAVVVPPATTPPSTPSAPLAIGAARARASARGVAGSFAVSRDATVVVRIVDAKGRPVVVRRGSHVGTIATGRARTAVVVHASAGATAFLLEARLARGARIRLVVTATGADGTTVTSTTTAVVR